MIPNRTTLSLAWSISAWENLRPLLLDANGWLIAALRWRRTREGSEALADAAKVIQELPAGRSLPQRDCLLVAVEAGELASQAAAALLSRVGPLRSQTVIALVFSRSNPTRWDGVVSYRGQLVPLSAFRIAGPRLPRVPRQRELPATPPVDGQFSRLLGAVGPIVFGKLCNATVTQVGTSRTGTHCAQMVAGLGVQRIRLCDGDVLGVENIDGMPGVSHSYVGKPKPFAVADTLLRQRAELSISCCPSSVLQPAASAILNESTDLFITCVDDDAARLAVSIQAQRLLVPHLDLSTSVVRNGDGSLAIFGDSRLFLPGQGCCNCAPALSVAEREEVLYRLAAPVGSLRRGEQPHWSDQRAGSLVTINAATVAAGVQSWLDLLAGSLPTSFWQRLNWAGTAGLRTQSGAIGPAADCPFCRPFNAA